MDLAMKFLRTASKPEVAPGENAYKARPELGDGTGPLELQGVLPLLRENADHRVIDSTTATFPQRIIFAIRG